MTGHRLMVVAVVLLCSWVFVVAGCSTPEDLSESSTATTAETARLYPVPVDGKWGFIDNTGTIKIEPRFDYADAFSEGLAVVGNKTGLDGELYMEFGYIDPSGSLVIPMERNTASSFSEGLAMFTVMDEGYPSYFLDKTGATVLGPFDFALNFSEGLAYVEWGDRCGYIDKTGDRVIELPKGFGRCQHASCCFSEGLALVEFSDNEVERHVFVDRSGVVVIGPQFDYAQDFSEGLAAAAIQEDGKVKWGYIDKTGAWVIEPQFDWAGDFSEGLAAVSEDYVSDAATYGYIDTTGAIIIPPRQCTGAEPFSDGVAALTGLGGVAGSQTPSYIDKTGKVIWQGL